MEGTNDYALLKANYDEIIKFAKQLSEEYKNHGEGWHDDICIRYNGEIYHTGLEKLGTSMDVHNDNAFVAFEVSSHSPMSLEEIKTRLDAHIAEREHFGEGWSFK